MPDHAARRPPLTREAILQAAVDLADQEGLGALTMRRLGSELGVKAMSLYKHVANKDEILDGIVEQVIGEIEIPRDGDHWKAAMRRRARSTRDVLRRHSWAVGLFETRRSTGPAVLRYLDAILTNLRSAGFSVEQAAHAFWLLDCYVYGQVIQEVSLAPGAPESGEEVPDAAPDPALAGEYPGLFELLDHASRTEYSVDDEFEYGLGLILDALERTRD